MITTKNNMINILDRMMNGNIDSFYSIIGDKYDEFLLFYDLFKTLGEMSFTNILYNNETDEFEVILTPSSINDVDVICNILDNTVLASDTSVYTSYGEGGTSAVVNITIGGE